jgi:hypothetical protein
VLRGPDAQESSVPCHQRLKLLRLGSDDAHARSLKPNPCAIETPICDTPYLRHHMLILPLNKGPYVGFHLYLGGAFSLWICRKAWR